MTKQVVKKDSLWKDGSGALWKPARRKLGLSKGWLCIEWSSNSDELSLFPDEDFGTELTFYRDYA